MNHFFTGQVFFQSWLDIKKIRKIRKNKISGYIISHKKKTKKPSKDDIGREVVSKNRLVAPQFSQCFKNG